MFSKLPEPFNRNFAVAYFLPFVAFLLSSIGILKEVGYLTDILETNKSDQILIGTTVLGLISWFGGIILLATNRDIIRLIEGYGRFNPLRLLYFIEKAKYKRIKAEISEINKEYIEISNRGEKLSSERNQRRNELMQKIVQRFPDQERWLLPTSFGNTIRAFEVYPRVMYGLDSIQGWNRLLSVIPEHYRVLIDDSKVNVDFWVNLGFLSFIFLLEYAFIIISAGQAKFIWIPFVTSFFIILSYIRAESSSVEWGDMVKSAFDVYLPELAAKLDFEIPSDISSEQFLWRKFSQSIIYANPEYMPKRNNINRNEN